MSTWEFMAHWGIWDMMGLAIALVPSVLVVIYLFPRRAIDNFYIDTKLATVNQAYARVIGVELRPGPLSLECESGPDCSDCSDLFGGPDFSAAARGCFETS